MDSHLWFQQLRKALRDQRVPTCYANRLIDELWLHYLETKERDDMNGFIGTDRNLDERLGSPEYLAGQAAQITRATWVGRHPWLTFLLGTQMMTIGLIITSLLLSAFLLLPFVQGKTIESDPWMGPLMQILGPAQVILPAALGCILMLRLVRRSYCSPWWGVLSCGVIAVLCLLTRINWSAPNSIPGSGRLSLGFGTPVLETELQAMIPIVIGLIYAWRNLPPRRQLVEESSSHSTRAAA